MLPRNCSGHLYDLLEVAPDSSTEEISRRYRTLALRYHPDRTGGETTEQFKEIEEAHCILTDPTQRRLYDTLGRERMKFVGSSGFLSSLFTIMALRSVLIVLSLTMYMVLLTFLLVGIQLDSRKGWSWGLIMLPLWLLSPFVVGTGVGVLVAAVRLRAYAAVLLGLELLMIVVGAIVSTLVLSGTLSPPSVAFIPWTVWYGLATLRCLYFLLPWEYAKRRKEMDAAFRAVGSSQTGEAGTPMEDNAVPEHIPSGDATPFAKWSWWDYGLDMAQELWELLCVVAFIILAYKRAAQGPVGSYPNSSNRVDGDFLSFWVLFAPLIAYFGVLVVLQGIYTYFCPRADTSNSTTDGRDGIPPVNIVFVDPHSGNAAGTAASAGGATSGASPARTKSYPSCGVRLFRAILAVLWPGAWLYMVCMWAAKMEWEYNHRGSENSLHPSFFVACMPLIAGTLFLALSSCCMCCGLGYILGEATRAEEVIPEQPPASAAGANEEINAQTWDRKTPNQVHNYHSVDRREAGDQVVVGISVPNAKTKAGPALEEID